MRRIRSGKVVNIFIFLLLFCVFCFDNVVYAFSNSKQEPILKQCVLSEDYLKWEQLSDEEKKIAPIPNMCDNEKNQSDIAIVNVGVNFLLGAKANSLPTVFDLREQSYVVPVKNQNPTNSCWAFSTTTNLEILMKKNYSKDYTFSARHIEYASTRNFLNNEINEWGYNRTLGAGGNYYMSSSYLANGLGPISEDEMPFEANENPIYLSEIKNKSVLFDVNDILLEYKTSGDSCTNTEINDIKKYIYEYGSIISTIHMTSDPLYYNSSTYSLNYKGSSEINHAITIVGWDDNYSKNNFPINNKPSNDGAWIVQNSYGSTWGDSGYFYISYEDFHICDMYITVTNVDYEKEDNYYIYDKLGHITYFGFQDFNTGLGYTDAYTMNVFNKESGVSETLEEVTFGTNGTGTYEVYFQEGNGTTSSSERILIGTGLMDYAGYKTHKLEDTILIDRDVEQFSIIVYYSMDTSTMPIPVSYSGVSGYQDITIDEGLSYASYDANNWYDLAKFEDDTVIIASIKAFTNDVVDSSMNVGNVTTIYNADIEENYLYKVSADVTYSNVDTNNLSLVILDNSGTEIDFASVTFSDNKIEFIFDKKVLYGTYHASIYYDDKVLGTFDFVVGDKLISSTYTIDQTQLLIYVQPNTSMTDFISKVEGLSNTFISENSNKGVLTTGMDICGYVVIVFGDVTGDGYVKMNDVMKISSYIVNGSGLDSKYFQTAADVTKDLNIKMNDVMKISSYIVEGGSI